MKVSQTALEALTGRLFLACVRIFVSLDLARSISERAMNNTVSKFHWKARSGTPKGMLSTPQGRTLLDSWVTHPRLLQRRRYQNLQIRDSVDFLSPNRGGDR